MVGSRSFLIHLIVLVVALLSRAESSVETEESLSTATATATATATTAVPFWPPSTKPRATVQDLHREYNTIFRYGNRNAASHRWSTFLLNRSSQMTLARLRLFFSGFCAVSGSPVRPNDYNRYKLTLPRVGGGSVTGTMHYCCWPCVCDTQDFIRIDTLTVTVANEDGDGSTSTSTSQATKTTKTHQLFFAVIGNPCDHPDRLEEPFYQPFYGGRMTTLSETAQEVRCNDDGSLEGATLSDHGYVIISMFFDAQPVVDEQQSGLELGDLPPPQPGRITTLLSPADGGPDNKGSTHVRVMVQDEREYGPRCRDRADNGYNSGMGEIFRKVCAISPIPTEALAVGEAKPPEQLETDEPPPSCAAATKEAGTITQS